MPAQRGTLESLKQATEPEPVVEILGDSLEKSEGEQQRPRATESSLICRYGSVLDGLAEMFGKHCEVSLYSLTEPGQPLLKRLHGEPNVPLLGHPLPEALALRVAALIASKARHSTYFAYSRSGAPIKTSLQLLVTARGETEGLLCIELHLSAPFHELLGALLPKLTIDATSATAKQVEVSPENFNNNVEELVTLTVERTIEGIGTDGLVANHLKNKHIVTTLYEKGIFDIKDAIAMVSNKLNISKHTVYLYIRQKKRDDEELSPPNPENS